MHSMHRAILAELDIFWGIRDLGLDLIATRKSIDQSELVIDAGIALTSEGRKPHTIYYGCSDPICLNSPRAVTWQYHRTAT